MSGSDGGSGPRSKSPDIPLISLAPSSSDAPSAIDIEARAGQDPLPDVIPIISELNPAPTDDVVAPTGFVKFDPSTELGKSNNDTEVDIIGVPAIGGDPEKTWTAPTYQLPKVNTLNRLLLQMPYMYPALPKDTKLSKPAWITRDIRSRPILQAARVALYSHGALEDGTTLNNLADRLLENIRELRRKEGTTSRPIFFVCHSTGGLVVKMALVKAQRAKDQHTRDCLHDCYGITFLGTPHRGSSYLSMANFSNTIRKVMELSCNIPQSIADHLQLDYSLLRKIDSDFKSLAGDLQIWSFFETIDSDLTNSELVESERYPFHAPITSIKSALLNLRHEVVFPLLSDHARCASFELGNEQTKEAYLAELARAIKKACILKKNKDYDMDLESQVQVEVIGFYTTLPTVNETSIRVVSTAKSLSDFLRDGPAGLLKARLREVGAPSLRPFFSVEVPEPRQHLKRDTRASSLFPNNPKTSSMLMTGAKISGKQKAKSKNRISLPASGAIPTVLEVIDPMVGGSSPPRSPTGSVASDSASHKSAPINLADRLRNTVASSSQPELSEALNGFNTAIPGSSRRLNEVSPISFHLHPSNPVIREDPRHQRRLSEGAIPRIASPLSYNPNEPEQKLLWIHVPFNIPSWVERVLECLSGDLKRNCYENLLNVEHWESKHQRGRHSEHHACFLKPGCSFIDDSQTMSIQMCLYLPYLHFDTYKLLVKRRNLIKSRVKQGRCRPVPQSVADLSSLEFRAIWQFLGHDPPINCRRTLDQFGYPSLLDTRARDDDQMLYKLTRAKDPSPYDTTQNLQKTKVDSGQLSSEQSQRRSRDAQTIVDDGDENDDSGDEPDESDEDIRDGNVLMVDQLWLWIVDNKSTVTFFPRKEPLLTDGRLYQQADLRNSIFNEVNADLTSKCENSFDLAALITLHSITVLFERTSHEDLEVFRVFEEAISILTEKMTTSFKRFRARGFRDKAIDYSDAVLRTTNIRARHKQEGERAEQQNRENTSALLELRDIEDELNTLKELFTIQSNAIQIMKTGYQRDDLHSLTANGLGFLSESEQKLKEYKEHTVRMIESVKSTRDDFDKLLQMVQRQAQVDEVRLARLQADLASAQSRSVMIFTVFTVIFLPLTFFTGLFGMNTQEWGGSNFKTLRTIGIISLPASAAIISLALIVAWSTRMRRAWNQTVHGIGNLAWWVKGYVVRLAIGSTVRLKGKKVAVERTRSYMEKRRRKRKERMATWQDGGPDFWESHKASRDEDYRVPMQNRMTVVKAVK